MRIKTRVWFVWLCATAACLPAVAVAAQDPTDGGAEAALVAVTVTLVRPYQPGDFVWTTSPPPPDAGSTLDAGCDRVPATGYIGTNVYADSGAHYANYWYWGQASSGQPYYWYVKKTDDTTQDSGYLSSGGSSSVPANIYRWKVQNKGSSPQAWQVCYDVS